MEKLSLKIIADAVKAKKIINENSAAPCGISIDSRTVKEGDLFFAIKGENFDGHDYIQSAFDNGAVAAISQKELDLGENRPVIVVEDTIKALEDLAYYYRRLFSTFVVGVTGSVGKTSTKEMIYAVLSYKQKTLKTSGNLNNEIGLPLTVMNLDFSYKNAVIEMGMSDFGEISVLSEIAAPNVGVITNIGQSHLETLGTRENILKAKLEILDGMHRDAPLIINNDNDMLQTVYHTVDRPIMSVGIDNYADIMASNIQTVGYNTEFDISYYGKKIHIVLPVVGRHNIYNALFAFAIGIIVDMTDTEIAAALGMYQSAAMRQELRSYDRIGVKAIIDCYNASPESMKAALSVLTDLPCEGRRVAVLGDMLELGENTEELHMEVGKQVGCSTIDKLICCGDLARHIKRGAVIVGMKEVLMFKDNAEAGDYLASYLKKGDLVLFKASRGVKLEQAVERLEQNIENMPV